MWKNSLEQYPANQIDLDFQNVVPLFKSSIGGFEDVEKRKDFIQKEKLMNLLNKESIIPKEKNIDAQLENKDSGIPLLNIGEFLFMTNPEKRTVRNHNY